MATADGPRSFIRLYLLVAFSLSGASALVFEVVWTRTLSAVMGSSTHALSTMLAAFMAGLSVGGVAGAAASRRVRDAVGAFALCELGIGIAGLVVAPLMRSLTPVYVSVYYTFHESFGAFYVVQFLIAFLLMGIPTTLMGATFPLAVRVFTEWKGEAGAQAGRLYAVNTFGGILGSVAAGFLLIPVVGATRTAAIAAALNILNALVLLALQRRVRIIGGAALLAVMVALPIVQHAKASAPTFSYGFAARFGEAGLAREIARGADRAEVLFHDDGADGETWLIREPGVARLTLLSGNKLEAGDTPSFALLANLPYLTRALIQPAKRALSIGLGSGNTLRAIAATPVEAIDSVEISSGIIEANRRHLNPSLFTGTRIRHVHADGRNFLLLHEGKYDLAVVSPSWAVEAGSAALLTREFFSLLASRLAPDGVAGVWVDFSIMEREDMTHILRAFAGSFRHVTAWRVPGGEIVLVGSNAAAYPDEGRVRRLTEIATPEAKGGFEVALSDAAPRPASLEGAYEDDLPNVEFHNARNLIVGAPSQ